MKIILERNLDFNQFKNVFILNFVCLAIFLMLLKANADQSINVLKSIFGASFFGLTCLLLLKKGMVTEKNKLFIGYFLFGLLIFKSEVNNNHMNIFTLLTFWKKPNYNYSSRWTNFNRWEPNLEYRTASFQLFFLNENHTIKKKILSLVKEENSEKAIEFLLQNTENEFQKFSPNF